MNSVDWHARYAVFVLSKSGRLVMTFDQCTDDRSKDVHLGWELACQKTREASKDDRLAGQYVHTFAVRQIGGVV